VGEDRRPARVDAGGEVVGDDAADRGRELMGDLPVGQHLVVGDQHDHLDAEVLEPDAVGEGAEVVADVERAGRPIAGQDAETAGLPQDPLLEGGAALECCVL
jgi:hypothetical protein